MKRIGGVLPNPVSARKKHRDGPKTEALDTVTRSLESFASKHHLVLSQNRNDLFERLGKRLSDLEVLDDLAGDRDDFLERLDKWSRCILGQNGSVIESSTPGRLLVSIVYLSGWERTKLEFRPAYHHIRVLTDRCSNGALWAEFSADNERQARLVIELAQLKKINTISSNMTPLYNQTLSQRGIPSANLIVASVLRRFDRALRELAR